MENRDIVILAMVGLVLFVIWRRTEADLAAAQARADGIAAGSALINLGGKAVATYYGLA